MNPPSMMLTVEMIDLRFGRSFIGYRLCHRKIYVTDLFDSDREDLGLLLHFLRFSLAFRYQNFCSQKKTVPDTVLVL